MPRAQCAAARHALLALKKHSHLLRRPKASAEFLYINQNFGMNKGTRHQSAPSFAHKHNIFNEDIRRSFHDRVSIMLVCDFKIILLKAMNSPLCSNKSCPDVWLELFLVVKKAEVEQDKNHQRRQGSGKRLEQTPLSVQLRVSTFE
jgi:hypothetical protein